MNCSTTWYQKQQRISEHYAPEKKALEKAENHFGTRGAASTEVNLFLYAQRALQFFLCLVDSIFDCDLIKCHKILVFVPNSSVKHATQQPVLLFTHTRLTAKDLPVSYLGTRLFQLTQTMVASQQNRPFNE